MTAPTLDWVLDWEAAGRPIFVKGIRRYLQHEMKHQPRGYLVVSDEPIGPTNKTMSSTELFIAMKSDCSLTQETNDDENTR